ncbi:MAG: hypothetical protein AAFY28_16305 [Actinomycetota bacterium]
MVAVLREISIGERNRSMAAFAAGLAVALVGALVLTGAWRGEAAPGDLDSTFVPVEPCRVMDTRPGSQVGPRNTPLGPEEPYNLQVTGGAGDCTGNLEIPAGAVAISMNVTIANPTAQSNLRLYPPFGRRPEVSNLNWLAGQSPTPNKVDVQIDAAGQATIENFRGTVDVIADVVGYYTDEELKQIVSRIRSESVDSASLSEDWSVVVERFGGSSERHIAFVTFELDEEGGVTESDIECGLGDPVNQPPADRWQWDSRSGGDLTPVTLSARLDQAFSIALICRSSDGDGVLRNVVLTVVSTGRAL